MITKLTGILGIAVAASTTWTNKSALVATKRVDLNDSIKVVGRFWINPTVSDKINGSCTFLIGSSLCNESTVAKSSSAT